MIEARRLQRSFGDGLIAEEIDVAHPNLLQILDLFSDQPVTEAALQASRLNHAASRRSVVCE